MRLVITNCLAMALLVPVGCISTPMSTAKRAQKPDSKEEAKFATAKKLEGSGNYQQAHEVYKELVLKHPKNVEYLHRMAVVCTQMQRYNEANSLYERACKQDPKNAALLTDMGYSSHLAGKDDDAEKQLRDALKQQPGDKRATSNLALVVGMKGRLDESEKLLRKVGSEASALSGLGYICVKRGEPDKAEQYYRDALAANPESKDAKIALAQIAKKKAAKDTTAVARVKSESPARKASPAFDFDEEMKDLEIQPVKSTASSARSRITTASLVEDDDPAAERETSDGGFSSVGQIAYSDEPATAEDDEQSDEDRPATTRKSIRHESPANDDDWSTDEPQAERSSNKKAKSAIARAMQTAEDAFADDEPVDPARRQTAARNSVPKYERRAKSVADQIREIESEPDFPSADRDQ